jgi:hypothetical protein
MITQVETIMPKEVYSQIESSLKAKLDKPRYARVFMAPSALLEHDFFNVYIKSGMYASSSVLEGPRVLFHLACPRSCSPGT